MDDTAIKIEQLSKQYRLGELGTGTISHDINRWWHKMIGKEDPYLKIGETNDRSTQGNSSYVWALKDINFEVKQGEVLGIIGKNGAGKSTLLKVLSKVTGPTKGSIKAQGRIASLLEVGTGFHPEMTGRENIFMNGTIMGMNRHEVKSKLDEIVEFAGVERYLDTPVKRYSSGMTVRLGFAIAAHLEPEILIVDEVLAVGDAEFQKKAIGKMQDVSKGEGRTVLFVSHNLSSIKMLCNKAILLENGQLTQSGTVDNVIQKYLSSNLESNHYRAKKETPLYVSEAYTKKVDGSASDQFSCTDQVSCYFKISSQMAFKGQCKLLIRIVSQSHTVLFSCETELIDGKTSYELTIPNNTLTKGEYHLDCIIYHPAVTQYDHIKDCCYFQIINNNESFSHLEGFDIGNVYNQHTWS